MTTTRCARVIVHEEDRWPADDRAGQGDALALAAGKLARVAVQQVLHVNLRRGLTHRLSPVLGRNAAHLQWEADVLGHRFVRVERVGLKDHGHVAVFRQHLGYVRIAQEHLTGIRRFEPCDDPQGGGLAAPRGAQQNQKFAGLDLNVDVLDHVVGAEPLVDALDR
jgi:hypothetical protein